MAPGHITITKEGMGEMQFGAIYGEIDCRVENCEENDRIEFTWEGSDEDDPCSGRGWALLNGNKMTGKIYFHLGEESGFKAAKKE